jgi:hypothetical protein
MNMKTHKLNYHYVIVILLLIMITLQMVSMGFFKTTRKYNKPLASGASGQCKKDTCGAIDDVNNPGYNMKNVVKQSILLEEHIAEKNKYCLSCIVKHFNHMIALCEEAVWLAEDRIKNYPFLDDSVDFYQHIFDDWLKGKHDEKVKKSTLSAIRERRRALVDVYFLDDTKR